MQLFTCLYTDTDFRDNWIPSDFSIQKLKMKLGFPDNRQLKPRISKWLKTNKQKFNIHKKLISAVQKCYKEIISVKSERIYTNVIRDVGLSCRFSDLR